MGDSHRTFAPLRVEAKRNKAKQNARELWSFYALPSNSGHFIKE